MLPKARVMIGRARRHVIQFPVIQFPLWIRFPMRITPTSAPGRGDDAGRGTCGGNDHPVRVDEAPFQEGDVPRPVHHAPRADDPARAYRPQKTRVEFQRGLEPVRSECGQKRGTDGVVEHGREKGAQHVPGRVGEVLGRGESQLDGAVVAVRVEDLQPQRGRRPRQRSAPSTTSQNGPDRSVIAPLPGRAFCRGFSCRSCSPSPPPPPASRLVVQLEGSVLGPARPFVDAVLNACASGA